ncbi:hypothetical protein KR067_001045 [Drosophila pandora]|nr:hypothetical protein KR067_001045 [Drosophila pandora]
MDKHERHSLMGPPPAVANSSNNNAAASFPEASSAGDKSAPPPKRIIKKINLDFKKLKESGLDRKLAEALSKQSPGAKPAKSSIPSAPTAAAASASPSTSTAAQQKPQLRQPAPQPIKKRAMVSDYIEKIVPGQMNVDSSMHVKALLKSRILNKSMGGMPAKYSASRPPPSAALGSPDSSPTPAVFSVPIAKADVTVRQKQPPLLLNLVNKLPKCRSLCTSSSYSSQKRSTSKEQQGVPPKAPEISQKPAPSTPVVPQRNCSNTSQEHNNMTTSPHPLPPPQLTPQTPIVLPQSSKSSLPPLIVLENKVLSPDEKIDLSSLAIQQVKPLEKSDVISPPVQAPISTNPAKGKVILSTQKLKLSREKLSEMANEIRNQVKKVEAIPQLETVPTFNASLNTRPSNVEPLTINKECTPEVYNSTMETPTVKSGDVSLFSSPVKQSKELLSSESVEVSTDTLLITEPEEVPVYNPCTPEPEELLEVPNTETKTATPETNQLSKEDTFTSTSKVLSAVDFIAQLTAENTLDDSSFMELSPEEQRLNALFGGGGFGVSSAMPVQEPEKVEVIPEIQKELPRPEPTVFVETPPDEELAIGKILKMDDVNILHATLDVNSDSTNILRISPNAVKLQKSVEILEKIAEEPNFVGAVEVPSEKPNLAANILAEQPTNSNDVEVPSEMKDPEPEKEVTPPVRKQPMRSKRAKINLVQRTKRPSAAKATEAKRPKPEFEENDEPAAQAERNEDMEIEVIANFDNPTSDIVSPNVSSITNNPKVSSDEERSKEVNNLGAEPDKKQSQRTTQQDEPEVDEDENEVASKPPTDRDLTQLYHPPKMPKNKSRKQNQNLELLDDPQPSTTGSNVSLIDILSQEQPPPQGEAKIPFRKEPEEVDSTTCSTPEAKGIQNLISHQEAEKVPTQAKKTSPSSEDTPKVGSRKKLVKTRPVLGKRSARVAQNSQPEKTTSSINPVPISIDVRNRVPTSSTSDDDRSETVGLEEKRTRTPVLSFQVAQKKVNETDISDDASPDHDETEDEQLSHVKKLKATPEVTKSEEKVEIHNQEADDSDSSSPRDFSESVAINADLILDEHPSEEPTKNVSLKPGDTSNVVEDNLEDSFRKLKNAKTVINEKVSPIPENSTRRSRRSTKKASEKELSERESEIPPTSVSKPVDNNVSTEKQEEPTVEKSKGKRQSRASLKAQKSLIPPEESKESEISIAVSSAAEETKIPEEPTTSVKSLRQRQSRSRTPKVANTSTGDISQPTDSSVENIETKEEKESASDNCKGKRKSRSCNSKKTVSKDLEKVEDTENTKTVTGDKKVEEEDKSAEIPSEKPIRKRASRSKTPKCIDATPPAEKPINSSDKQGEVDENPQTTAEPEITPQTREKRKSRSRKAIPDKSKDSQERENPVSKPEELETSQSDSTNLTEVSKTEESADKTEDLVKESVLEEFKLPEKSVKPKATRRSRIKESQPESLQSPVINQEVANESDVVPSPVQSKKQRRSRCAEPKYVDEVNSAMKRKSRSQPDPETTPIPKDEVIQTPKLRRRKEPETPKAEDVEPLPPSLDTPKTPARRGRKRAAEADCELAKKLKEEGISVTSFNLRLLLVRKREQLETEEVVTSEGEGDGPLQCGLCLARSTTENWQNHLLEHYGVGWLIENTPEIITRGLVIKKMKDFLQKNPEKRLGCRLCNQQLTSAMGMMLHLENCGRQRVKCEFCKKLYASMTLPQHLRVCAKRSMIEKANEQDPAEESKELVFSNAGRAKRKSTIKAETKLKKIGEALTSENSAMETDQQKDFDGDSSDYDMAMDKESSDEYASEGADSNEDPILSEAESEGKGNKRSKKSKANDASRKRSARKRPVILGDVSEKPRNKLQNNVESLNIIKYYFFSLQISYAKGSLFPQFEPSYSIIPLEEAQTLLPSKDSKSIRYAFGDAEKSGDWKQMGLFEGFMNDGDYIGYLGGAIKQLAWAPLPSQVKTQYLLCSLRTKLKSYTKHVKIEGKEDALLMLLKCSVPDHNPSDNFSSIQLDLHYGVRVPNGPVHSFVFMPSGGYDESTNRLGLLAVSNSMSDVHIYALPLNLPGDEQTGTDKNVIQLNSLLTLSLDITNSVQDQCTRICWSQARGHNFLVTGYAKGNVACWDIGDTEGLNCIKQDNQIYIAPLNFFFIGERNIQYLDLHYDANGPRWLAVGTNVRRFCIFDIKNWSQPYPLVEGSSISHLYVTSLFWSPICETIIVGSNELFVNRMTRNLALSPSGINYDYKTLESTVSSTRAMHSNIQKNYLVLGTDNGDLVFVDERDLNFPPALNKSAFIVRAVSTLDLVHLSEATSDPKDPITPETFFRDYALRIKPVVPVQPKGRTTYLSEKRMPKNLTSLPLTRYNCVHCNWNSPANSLVAVGTEHGLLRILNFQRDKFFQRQP